MRVRRLRETCCGQQLGVVHKMTSVNDPAANRCGATAETLQCLLNKASNSSAIAEKKAAGRTNDTRRFTS